MEVDVKTPVETMYDKLGPKVVKALEKRFFEAWYFSDIPEAVEKVFSLIPKTDTVSWGGSTTAVSINLTTLAAEKGYTVIDRDKAANPEERIELMRKALLCDTYLAGTNAISEDGQLFNVDKIGNRVAAMIYGPRQVIVVAGMNKIVRAEADAWARLKAIAAPANAQRFPHLKTPCNETGSCAECLSADSICAYFVKTRLSMPKGKIKVILIGKNLGF